MTNSVGPTLAIGERAARLRGAVPTLLLLLGLVVASLVSGGIDGLRLASPDRSHVDQLRAAIGDLPDGALVLIACDADLGTYPEIRATTRAAIDDLAARGARLAIVNQDKASVLARAKGQTAIVELNDPSADVKYYQVAADGSPPRDSGRHRHRHWEPR